MKNNIKSILKVFIILLLVGCDFKDIQSFDMPTWNWPLTFPLIEEKYSFAEMGVIEDSLVENIYYNS